MTMSRRFFMGTGVVGGMSLAAGLGLTGAASAAEVCGVSGSGREDEFIASTAQALSRISEEHPDAAGLNDLGKFIESTYPVEMGSKDDRLLQGALYLEAQRLFEMRAAPPSHETLAQGLSSKLDVEQVNPEYFSRLLERTKARMACDSRFAEEVNTASERAAGLAIPCHGRWWLCIGIIVVVVVVVIVLL